MLTEIYYSADTNVEKREHPLMFFMFVAEVEINECVSKICWTEQHLTIPVKTILLVSLS